jgi:hypothetical protein
LIVDMGVVFSTVTKVVVLCDFSRSVRVSCVGSTDCGVHTSAVFLLVRGKNEITDHCNEVVL